MQTFASTSTYRVGGRVINGVINGVISNVRCLPMLFKSKWRCSCLCRFALLHLEEHLLDLITILVFLDFLTLGKKVRHATGNDCFAGDPVEDAEETNIPLSSVSIGERPLCNLRFADDIDLLGGSEKELPTANWKTGKNGCWSRRGSQLRQKQTSRQQHQAKTEDQHVEKRFKKRAGSNT